jgi:putative ABC transport system substrate-binding protein
MKQTQFAMRRSRSIGVRKVSPALTAIVTLTIAMLVSVPPATAEDARKQFKLGTVNPGTPVPRFSQAETEALRAFGYVEGQNLVFIERWAGGSEAQIQRDAAELVKLEVDAIVAGSSAGARAATAATKTIPIVAIDLESDPVAKGWASTIARPGGNITGCFLDLPQLPGKRLEQLQQLLPRLSRIAVLWDTSLNRTPLAATAAAARTLGLRMTTLDVRRASDLEQAFSTAVKQRVQAVLIWGGPLFDANAPRIADLAIKHRLPVAGFFPFHPEAGFLLSYGPDVEDMTRRCMAYVDRIFRGEKPGDLPLQFPEKLYLVLNQRTADRLGIRFPAALEVQAERIIK